MQFRSIRSIHPTHPAHPQIATSSNTNKTEIADGGARLDRFDVLVVGVLHLLQAWMLHPI